MKDKIKNVDMDAVMAYMIKNDCRLDEAIEAVSKTETPTPQPVPKRNKLSDRMSDRSFDSRGQEAKSVSDRMSEQVVRKNRITEKPKTKLKAARLNAGLSQNELALKADLNLRTLQAYEQGYKSFDNARLETILRVAVACGCRLEDLIESPSLLELVKNYNEV